MNASQNLVVYVTFLERQRFLQRTSLRGRFEDRVFNEDEPGEMRHLHSAWADSGPL